MEGRKETEVSPGPLLRPPNLFLIPRETPSESWGLQDPKLCSQRSPSVSRASSLERVLSPRASGRTRLLEAPDGPWQRLALSTMQHRMHNRNTLIFVITAFIFIFDKN